MSELAHLRSLRSKQHQLIPKYDLASGAAPMFCMVVSECASFASGHGGGAWLYVLAEN